MSIPDLPDGPLVEPAESEQFSEADYRQPEDSPFQDPYLEAQAEVRLFEDDGWHLGYEPTPEPENLDGQVGANRHLAIEFFRPSAHMEAVWDALGATPLSHYPSAKEWWEACPQPSRHFGDRKPPKGALLYFENGDKPGIIAISLGDGLASCLNRPSAARTDVASIDDIEASWGGRPYIGWADWLFGHRIVNLGL